MRRLSLFAVMALFILAVAAPPASALTVTVIKVDLGGTIGPDVGLTGTTFGTISDGMGATTGDQNTSVTYQGFLSGLPAITTGNASFSLTGVTLAGPANVIGSVVNQLTTGGTFNLWDPSNSLLLSGLLTGGDISGTTTSSAGSFFNVGVATFTGGSLLTSYLASTPAALSLSLTGIIGTDLSGNQTPGLYVHCNGSCNLNNFTANATGLIDGAPVPEPASALLLLSGFFGGLGGLRLRRRS
jgi:hypothetical protein